jgi:hypothetical protein
VLYFTVLYCALLYCAVLYCTVLYCGVLCFTVLYCTVLCFTVLYCAVLCFIVLYCAVLCFTVLYCTVLYCALLCCTVLYCAVLYCMHNVTFRRIRAITIFAEKQYVLHNLSVCGNKMPIRWNRCFLLQILMLAQHVSGTIIPIIRSSIVLFSWLLLFV